MLNFSLVCKRESDYFQNALQENNSNNTNTAEVENLKRTILELREENNALKKENSTLKKESSSLKIDKANLSNERRNDARKIKRLENELKSSENKAKAVKVRHEKEVQKLNRRLTGKEKAVKMLRHGNTMNNIADMMSQKMSTRSSQHRQNPSIKSEPSETKSEPKSSNPKRSEADSVMKDDDEDEILASPQASQGKIFSNSNFHQCMLNFSLPN